MTAWRCTFYERIAVAGGFRFDMISILGPKLTFDHPPAVGDLIYLQGSGSFRVIERSILPVQFGSMGWSSGEAPETGPLVDFILEREDGPFRDEVSDDTNSPTDG